MPIPAKPFWLSAAYAEFGGNRWMSDTANRAGIPAPRWLGDLAGRSAWTWNAIPSSGSNSVEIAGTGTGTVTVQYIVRALNGLTGVRASGVTEVYASPTGPCDVYVSFVSGTAITGTLNTWVAPTAGGLIWGFTSPRVGNGSWSSTFDITYRAQSNNSITKAVRVTLSGYVMNGM